MKQFDTDTDDMQMSEDYKPTYITASSFLVPSATALL